MTERWIDLRYKCQCMAEEQTFRVPERRRGEDIGDFIKRVQMAMGQDHVRRSPLCLAKNADLKIPIVGDVVDAAEGGTA